MKHLKKLEGDFVKVNKNKITFTIQDGTIPKNGVNGMQAMDVINTLRELFVSLNEAFPCEENIRTIGHLDRARHWQTLRTIDRTNRKVEGKELK